MKKDEGETSVKCCVGGERRGKGQANLCPQTTGLSHENVFFDCVYPENFLVYLSLSSKPVGTQVLCFKHSKIPVTIIR